VIPTGRLGLPVERDRHRTAAHPLSAYATASKERLVDRLQGRCMQAAVWTAARSRTFATQLFRLMPSRLAAETAARCNGGSTRTTNWPENGFSGPELLPGNMVTDGGATFGRHERDAGSRERKPAVPSDGLTNQPILLEHYYLPGELERRITAFVEHYNHARYHESLDNLTPADVYFGRAQTILAGRQRFKRETLKTRRLQHHLQAA
jgi:transposase InsO family protein